LEIVWLVLAVANCFVVVAFVVATVALSLAPVAWKGEREFLKRESFKREKVLIKMLNSLHLPLFIASTLP